MSADRLEEKSEEDDLKEEDLVRAFAKISQTRRESSISISDACRLFSRQSTRYVFPERENEGCITYQIPPTYTNTKLLLKN